MGIESVKGKLLIITGPSGAGKDAAAKLFQERNRDFGFIVTCTSRGRRPGEVDEVDYKFFDLETFLRKKSNGEFAEVCEYRPNEWKGTLREDVRRVCESNLIWRVDPSMAGRAKAFFYEIGLGEIVPRVRTAYIGIESRRSLHDRKQKRDGTGFDEVKFKQNLKKDYTTWREYKDCYDRVIVNRYGMLEETVLELEQLVCNIL